MTTADSLPILVGVDGSGPSLAAARWAAKEAKARGRPLRLVHTYVGPMVVAPLVTPPYEWLPDAMRKEAEAVVATATAAVRAEVPDLPVTGAVVAGVAGEVLIGQSEHAHLVVLGHRGHGGFAGLLLGSVTSTVAAHAHAPVVVVRPAPAPPEGGAGPVVVGVDGSQPAQAALEFGFDEAELHSVPLHAVHAWRPPSLPPLADIRFDAAEIESAEHQRAREWVRPWQERHPRVPVTQALVSGQAADALVDAGRGASLLVVGSRGRGGFAGLLLGSTSQQVIQHAACPVAVVR
jgi:nucleotide-binding universal stress UspA family protein